MYKVYDDETLKKLHKVELEILNEFVRICDKNNLQYTLFAGSMLGAVRHAGFIPWDDDIDVGMLRDDYDKFLKIAYEELDSKFYLDCFEYNKEYYLPFAKIKKNGTIFDEEGSHHIHNHKGIYIDIFPIDNVYDNPKKSYMRAVITKIIRNTIIIKQGISNIKEARHKVLVSLFRIFSFQSLMQLEKKLVTSNKDNHSKYVGCFFSVYPFKKEIIERNDFLPTIKLKFEDKEYQVINNYDKYLKSVYGNYLELPPEEKRVNHMPLEIDFGDKSEN